MDYSEVVAKIKPSIALIIAGNKDNILGTGSGFVFGKKGIIVTCNHVVKDATVILVKFSDAEHVSAKIVVRDEEHDLALLKFDDNSREPIKIANLEEVKEGMPVMFSGYPLNIQDLTTHQGIISAIIKDATRITTYLIDGTVNSGNSGCPLMNSKGEVIGVVNAKRRESAGLLKKVENMMCGAISVHGVDLVSIYQALINNVQLGIGYAVPACYVPEHKEINLDTKKSEKVIEDNKENS